MVMIISPFRKPDFNLTSLVPGIRANIRRNLTLPESVEYLYPYNMDLCLLGGLLLALLFLKVEPSESKNAV